MGCSEVARVLGVSPSTVKNLWNTGKLAYRCADNQQCTRKSSPAMIDSYVKHYIKF